MRGEEPSNFSVAIFFPFPTLSCNLYIFTLYTRQTCQIPAFRYMRLILTLSPSQMYEDETSGGLFLLLLSSRRLLCRQVGLAGFILHSQVSHFSSCFSFLDDPVCFSQSIHSGCLQFLLILRPGQMRWLVLASRKGRRVRRRLTPTGEHTIKWG